MKTFVLCGGEGTRLRPYTYTLPKPMLPVAGKPILQYVIENLKENGLTDLVLTVGYLKEKIIDYFGDGKKFGVQIGYEIEDEAMNTAGSIMNFKGKLNETFLVVMGDQITNIQIIEMLEFHKKNKAVATIGLLKHKTPLDFGVVKVKEGRVEEFVEKPIIENYINLAAYVFEPKIFDYIKQKEDFARDVLPRVIKSGEKINAYTFENAWFFDLGRINDYESVNNIFEIMKVGKIKS